MKKQRRVFITGCTGTLGQAVTKILLEDPSNLIFGFSRDEMKQAMLPKNPRVTLILGDIRNEGRLLEATRNMDLLFHFAALKRVDTLEENPEESILTNIVGTMNVLHAQRMNKIPRVVLSSTDKAVYPVNVYGACKMISERLVMRNPNNVVVRYGNVIASRGSVIPEFVKSIRNENKAYITSKKMTRFFLTPEEAAGFVVKSAFEDKGGLKIPDIKATRITSVVSALSKILGKNPKSIEVGIRPGEKLHEALVTSEEGSALFSNTGNQFTEKELILKLKPIVDSLS